jgi:hypothetical protein
MNHACQTVVAVFIYVACSIACTPTNPSSSDVRRFEITEPLTALKVGERWGFSVLLDLRPVANVSWTSDQTAVCAITSDGLASALRPGRATLTASDGPHTSSITVRVVPDAAGEYRGMMTLVYEKRVSGNGPWRPGSFSQAPYTAHLDQVHDHVTIWDSRLDGLVEYSGTVDVTGTINAVGKGDLGEIGKLKSTWTGDLSADARRISGEFIDVWSFFNFWGRQVLEQKIAARDLPRQ